MEVYLPRSEILRLVRAHLGIQTDNSLGSQVEEQHVAVVQSAALKVMQDCRWVNAVEQTTVMLQAEQNVLDYPFGSHPGAILNVSVYDGGQYLRLRPQRLTTQFASDQQQIVGGIEFQRVTGRPQAYDQQKQITFWPFSDKEYPVRIEYQRPSDLPTDETVSIVDGQLIVLWAASMLSLNLGDVDQSRLFSSMYLERQRMLQAWQSSGTTFAMSSAADLAEGEGLGFDEVPRWDRSPTRPML